MRHLGLLSLVLVLVHAFALAQARRQDSFRFVTPVEEAPGLPLPVPPSAPTPEPSVVPKAVACSPANYIHVSNTSTTGFPADFCPFSYLPWRVRLPDNPQAIDTTNTAVLQNEYIPTASQTQGANFVTSLWGKPVARDQGGGHHLAYIASPTDPLISIDCNYVHYGCSDMNGNTIAPWAGGPGITDHFRIPPWARFSGERAQNSDVFMSIIQPDGHVIDIGGCITEAGNGGLGQPRDWQNGDVIANFGSPTNTICNDAVYGGAYGLLTDKGKNDGSINAGDAQIALPATYQEVVVLGEIRHALHVYASCFSPATRYPGTFAGVCNDQSVPPNGGVPTGAHIWLDRTRAQIDAISAERPDVIPPHMRVFAYALHEHGAYMLDTGSPGPKWISQFLLESAEPALYSGTLAESYWTPWFTANSGGVGVIGGDYNLKMKTPIRWQDLGPYLHILQECYARGTCSDSVPDPGTPSQQLAFPTAEGFGRFAQGGRGGIVIPVTNLNTSGPGSFRACLEATGPRTCIFRVGGIIDWPCQACGYVVPPYLTIAGQTAPGDGIMIQNMELQFRDTHDIIVRHVRVRPGKNVPVPASAGGIEMFGPTTPTHDVIIDHFSTGWTPDDTTGGDSSYNITYQWGIISEGLGNGPGDPSKCMLWTPTGLANAGLSLLHTYMVNMGYRCPSFDGGDQQMVNNVLYNIETYGSMLFPVNNLGPIRAEYVANYYRPGPSVSPSDSTAPRIVTLGCGYDPAVNCTDAANSRVYLSGNIHTTLRPNNSYPEASLVSAFGSPTIPLVTTAFGFPPLVSQTSAVQAVTEVLARAGARVPRLDSIDQRAIDDFNNGTGRMNIGDEAVVGGYPTYNSGTPYTDTDGDGMSDAWESAHGLNPTDPSDGPRMAVNGYTNLENFLNELAGDAVPSLPPPVLPPGLRVHWTLDEGGGTRAADASDNGVDGTLRNGPLWVPGRVGPWALQGDGLTQYVSNDAFVWAPQQPVTVVLWVKTPSGVYNGTFGVGGQESPQRLGAHIPWNDNMLYWDYGSTTGGRLGVSFVPYLNQWTHVALVSNGVDFQAIYLNGVPVASQGVAMAPTTPLTGLTVGHYRVGTSLMYQTGQFDDFRLYNQVLTASEIAGLYQSSVGTHRAQHRVVGQ